MKSENDNGSGKRWWIWLLAIILLILLMVPFGTLGIAIKKITSRSGLPDSYPPKTLVTNALSSSISAELQADLAGIKEGLQKFASNNFHMTNFPNLNPHLKSVEIEASPAAVSTATEEIHQLLRDRNHQFVEAQDHDRIRIVVILPSNEWAELSGCIQKAAQSKGLIYRGPSKTETEGNKADSMVAEIEILKIPKNGVLLK